MTADDGARHDAVALWDAEAATFDEAADHGLHDPAVRVAWRDLLLGVLPPAPARVLDVGCGTGTLSVLLAEAGHRVDGVDLSPEMVRRAEAKAAVLGPEAGPVSFVVADAADPPGEVASYDVVLCRHVLWALPDPAAALAAWERLLVPSGLLVLVEGHWGTGAGLTAEQAVDLVTATSRTPVLTRLPEPVWWGRIVTDDRYLVVGRPEHPAADW